MKEIGIFTRVEQDKQGYIKLPYFKFKHKKDDITRSKG